VHVLSSLLAREVKNAARYISQKNVSSMKAQIRARSSLVLWMHYIDVDFNVLRFLSSCILTASANSTVRLCSYHHRTQVATKRASVSLRYVDFVGPRDGYDFIYG